jgi:hypothetical protein
MRRDYVARASGPAVGHRLTFFIFFVVYPFNFTHFRRLARADPQAEAAQLAAEGRLPLAFSELHRQALSHFEQVVTPVTPLPAHRAPVTPLPAHRSVVDATDCSLICR